MWTGRSKAPTRPPPIPSIPYSWDASAETPGSSHTIQAKAYDAAENVGESSIITVKIAEGEGPTEHEGTISSDETWYAADNPHIVTGDVDVEATLTLEPGVIVKFNAGTYRLVFTKSPKAISRRASEAQREYFVRRSGVSS